MSTPKSRILPLALALVTLGAVIRQSEAASFIYASSMHNARGGHTATLLPNGKVLLAGGSETTTTAELFDPATGTWTVTGAMRASRGNHRATLLPNGKVLVEGGAPVSGSSSVLSSAELYDPKSGTWTFTAPMATPRAAHTATLLANGKVLVAGGLADSLGSAELYDPASGIWTPTGALNIPRAAHTATSLPDGKVLVVGGSGSASSSAELYDPNTGTWIYTAAPVGSFPDGNKATLLPNGKVLVAGGCPCTDSGDNPGAEVYDPASETWTPTGPMITGRGWHTVTLLPDGKVLVAGGYSGQYSAELYDPATGTWTETASMSYSRLWHTATLLPNGNVLVAGGVDLISGAGRLSSAEVYYPDLGGAPPSLTILHNSNQILSFYWSGTGTLEQADSLSLRNWQPAPTQDNPHTISTTDSTKFFRVKAN